MQRDDEEAVDNRNFALVESVNKPQQALKKERSHVKQRHSKSTVSSTCKSSALTDIQDDDIMSISNININNDSTELKEDIGESMKNINSDTNRTDGNLFCNESKDHQKHAWNIDVDKMTKSSTSLSSDKSIESSSSTLKLSDSTLATTENLNYVPARLNSPFFLKQLDISKDIMKQDPNLPSLNIATRSAEKSGKKSSAVKKPRGFSLISNSGSESYSRSSSAYDSSTSNVRVAVRVRPLCASEEERGDKEIIEYPGQGSIWVDIDSSTTKPFTFNTIFDDRASQNQVFEECGIRDLIEKALDGFSCTVFAFGQTGSGKTHTITGPVDQNVEDMLGNNELPGLVPRSIHYMYEAISKRPTLDYRIKASFLEVYNEKVKDLLNPSNAYDTLPVRWSGKKGFYVDNLFTMECECLEDLMSILIEGSLYKQVGMHAMNDHSSRSHSILTVYVDCEEEFDSDEESALPIVKHGKISFVDLAGSERVKETKSTGESLAESNNINKSLLTLGNCISALGDPKKKGNHIPYRESKLTKLLADSLGGDGFTLMIACISPSSYVLQDTMNTLRYANRAKNIKNKPIVKMDPREQVFQRIKRELKLLKAENTYFRKQLGVPYSESQIILTPNQIEGELTENESGTLSPAIGADTLSSIESSRNNSCKDFTLKDDFEPRATTAIYALGAKNGLYGMLQEYMNENESLKTENMQLHRSRAIAQRQQEEMFRENERLSRKLDDLGRVMLSTPLSREHVKTWISSGSPGSTIFSRQIADENGVVSANDPTGEKPVRFPPVRQGSYPNYVNSVNLSAEVEYEKQKLRQKKEKEKLSSDNVTSKTHTPKSPSLATSLDTPPNKTKSGNQLSTSLANRSKDYLNNGVDTKENEKNYEVVAVKENLSNGSKSSARSSSVKTRDVNKTRKNTLPRTWRMKNKAPVVEKPGSYAARFAARKGLLSKHMSQRQPAVPHQNIDTTLLQQQQQQQQMQQEIATSQYPSYSQIPVYGYNSNYGQYPYMGIGVTPASQGIQQEMPMNGYNNINKSKHQDTTSLADGHIHADAPRLKQTNARTGRWQTKDGHQSP